MTKEIEKKVVLGSVKQRVVEISNEIRINKDGENTFAKYNYFQPDTIMATINPLLKKYSLIALFQMRFNNEKNMYAGLLRIEEWKTEEHINYHFDIPLTEVKGSSQAQNAGATQTYCKRYMLMNAFNIADNNADPDATKNEPVTKGQGGTTKAGEDKGGTTTSKPKPVAELIALVRQANTPGKIKEWRGWIEKTEYTNAQKELLLRTLKEREEIIGKSDSKANGDIAKI